MFDESVHRKLLGQINGSRNWSWIEKDYIDGQGASDNVVDVGCGVGLYVSSNIEENSHGYAVALTLQEFADVMVNVLQLESELSGLAKKYRLAVNVL